MGSCINRTADGPLLERPPQNRPPRCWLAADSFPAEHPPNHPSRYNHLQLDELHHRPVPAPVLAGRFCTMAGDGSSAQHHYCPKGLLSRRLACWLPSSSAWCLAGFTGISGIINPVTILFTENDREAMQWITAQTPQDAVFYVDSFQWGTSISPSNGGGWIHRPHRPRRCSPLHQRAKRNSG